MNVYLTPADLAGQVERMKSQNGLSQKEMADAVGVAQSNLSRALGGQSERYAAILVRILEYYEEWNADENIYYRFEVGLKD